MKRWLLVLLLLLCGMPSALPQNIRVAKAARIRSCELHIWGTGTSGVLQDTDDEPASCYNSWGSSLTITAVRCWTNAGSPTIMPTNPGVSNHNILSGNLTCTNPSFASGSLTGTGADLVVAAGGTVDIGIVAAGGTATNIRVIIEFRL